MLSCQEASRLASEGLDRKLPSLQRWRLRLHLLLCSACRAYKREIEGIHRLIRARFTEGQRTHGEGSSLSDASRERIKRRLYEIAPEDGRPGATQPSSGGM